MSTIKAFLYCLASLTLLSACSNKKADTSTNESSLDELTNKSFPTLTESDVEEGKQYEKLLRIDEFEDGAIWGYHSSDYFPDLEDRDSFDDSFVRIMGNYILINNDDPVKYRLSQSSFPKALGEGNKKAKNFLSSYFLNEDDALYIFEFSVDGKDWSKEISPITLPNVALVLCNSKYFFFLDTFGRIIVYSTQAYEGNLYPLPLDWNSKITPWKAYSIDNMFSLTDNLKKFDPSEQYYAYYVLHRDEIYRFYLLVSSIVGSEFDQSSYHLVSIGKGDTFSKVSIPTQRANVYIDKELNITLTHDPLDAVSFNSYTQCVDSSSVFVEKYKVRSNGKIELVSKDREVLHEKAISPIEYNQQCINNVGYEIIGLENILNSITDKPLSIDSESEENPTNTKLSQWYKKQFGELPYALTFAHQDCDLDGLRYTIVNPYEGGDYDNDYGLMVSKGNTILSYLDLASGGYHMANYEYRFHRNGIVETGASVLDQSTDAYDWIFRMRDRWQVKADGSIVKIK